MSASAPAPSQTPGIDKDFEQLKLLFDYTKFHIGLYTTVATILGAVIAAKDGPFAFRLLPLQCSVFFICLAGFAGGVIVSSITQAQSYTVFWASRLGPFRLKWFTAEMWTYIEHGAFWIAVVLAVFAVVPK